jgi:hypothetical protein
MIVKLLFYRDMSELQNEVSQWITEGVSGFVVKLMTSFEDLQKRNAQKRRAIQMLDYNHQLSEEIFDSSFIINLKTKLTREAKKKGFDVLPQTVQEYYSTSLSHFYLSDDDLFLIFHVPVVRAAESFSIFMPVVLPTPIPKNHRKMSARKGFIKTSLPDELLAVYGGPLSEKRVFSSNLKFDNCHTIYNLFVCPRFYEMNEQLESSCIGSLFDDIDNNDAAAAKVVENCEFGTIPYKEWNYQVSRTEHILFATDVTPKLKCTGDPLNKSDRFPILLPNQTLRMELPAHCGIEMATFSIWASSTFQHKSGFEAEVILNLENFWPREYSMEMFIEEAAYFIIFLTKFLVFLVATLLVIFLTFQCLTFHPGQQQQQQQEVEITDYSRLRCYG